MSLNPQHPLKFLRKRRWLPVLRSPKGILICGYPQPESTGMYRGDNKTGAERAGHHRPRLVRRLGPADWYDRYNRRFEDYRLPKSKEDRYTFGEQIGRDGMQLWQRLGNHPELAQLRNLPAMETLWQVWLCQLKMSG